MKRRKSSISSRQGQPGRTSKGYGASVCWKGVPEVEELWNTVLVTSEGRGFAGCVCSGVNKNKRIRHGQMRFKLLLSNVEDRVKYFPDSFPLGEAERTDEPPSLLSRKRDGSFRGVFRGEGTGSHGQE